MAVPFDHRDRLPPSEFLHRTQVDPMLLGIYHIAIALWFGLNTRTYCIVKRGWRHDEVSSDVSFVMTLQNRGKKSYCSPLRWVVIKV